MEIAKFKPNIRIPAKASAWYIASGAMARGIGVLCTPIFTRLLTPGEYGLYSLYNTWIGVLTVVMTLELSGSVIYRGLQKFSDRKQEFISAAFGLFTSIYILLCALYFAFSSVLNKITGLNNLTTFLMLMQILASTVVGFYSAKARFEYNYKAAALINTASSFFAPIIAILLILTTGIRAEARIIGSSLSLSLFAIPIGYNIVRKMKPLFDKEIWIFLLKFCLPLLPHYFSMSLILRIGEIVIGRSYGTGALGKYSVAMSIGMSLTVITNGILSALSPWILRKIKGNDQEHIKEFLMLITKGLCVMCLIGLVFAPELIKILASPEFYSALPAVYPLQLAIVPMFLSNALMTGGMYYEKSARSAMPAIISAGISVLLSVLILPRVDYRFVSMTVLIAYTCLAALNALTFKKLSGYDAIDIRKIASAFSLTLLYAAVLFLFHGVIMSRIVLLLPLIPISIYYGRQILMEIKEK